jgi:hypothetical protein
MDSVPYNYTDVPPSDMGVVVRNVQIIDEIMSKECSELWKFVDETTKSIYSVLSILIEGEKTLFITLSFLISLSLSFTDFLPLIPLFSFSHSCRHSEGIDIRRIAAVGRGTEESPK